MNIENYLETLDLSKPEVVGDLDVMLKSFENLKELSMDDICNLCPKRKDVTSILIGLWASGFLRSPLFDSNYGLKGLKNYKREYLTAREKHLMLNGLFDIIRYSHIDNPEDHDAIDYIYSVCRNLYLLIPDELEANLVEQFILNPTASFIDALGILVRDKHSIEPETFILLKNAANSPNEKIASMAKEVLEEDVKPMNDIYNFL